MHLERGVPFSFLKPLLQPRFFVLWDCQDLQAWRHQCFRIFFLLLCLPFRLTLVLAEPWIPLLLMEGAAVINLLLLAIVGPCWEPRILLPFLEDIHFLLLLSKTFTLEKKKFYLFFWEGECKQERGREKGGQRIQSRLGTDRLTAVTMMQRLNSWTMRSPPEPKSDAELTKPPRRPQADFPLSWSREKDISNFLSFWLQKCL